MFIVLGCNRPGNSNCAEKEILLLMSYISKIIPILLGGRLRKHKQSKPVSWYFIHL